MFAIDGTLLVIFFSFLVFMMVLKGLFFDPLAKIKKTRVDAVVTAASSADAAGRDRQNAADSYAARIKEAQQQALQSVQVKRDEARQKATAQVAHARAEALSRVDSQAQALRQSQESAYQSLSAEKESYILAIVAKLSAGQLSASAGAPHASSVS